VLGRFQPRPKFLIVRSEAGQLGEVGTGEATEDGIAVRSGSEPDQAPVDGVGDPAYQTCGHRPINELDDAVMAKHQILRKVPDGGSTAIRVGPYRQEELVLRTCQPCGLGLLFAPPLEAPQTSAEPEEPFVVFV
jgi:hypothetical protein